jgi:hypothetical protein
MVILPMVMNGGVWLAALMSPDPKQQLLQQQQQQQ